MKVLSIAGVALALMGMSACRPTEGAEMKKFAVRQMPTLVAPGLKGTVWFAAENPPSVNLMNSDGKINPVIVLSDDTRICGIAATADGGLWFTTYVRNNGRPTQPRIHKILPDGTAKQFSTPRDIPAFSIAADKNGVGWFTQQQDRIGRIDTDGSLREYQLPELPGGKYNAWAITSDGNDMWVTTMNEPAVIRIFPTGMMERHPIPWGDAKPRAISAGSDGVWFSDDSGSGNIGHIDKEGIMHKIPIPRKLGEAPFGIAQAKNGIWIVGLAYVGKMRADGVTTKLPQAFGQSIASTADGKVWVSANITNFGAAFIKRPYVGAIWQFDEN